MTYQEMQKRAYDVTDKILKQQEKDLLRLYKKLHDEIRGKVKTVYANLSGVDRSDYIHMSQRHRLDKLNKEIRGVYATFSRKEYNIIESGQADVFESVYNRMQYATMLFAQGKGFTRLNPLVNKLSVTGDMRIWRQIRNKALRDEAKALIPTSGKTLRQILTDNNVFELRMIQQTIKQGLINGESYAKQARRLVNRVNIAANKAMRIVQTEGNRNKNAGAYWNSVQASKQVKLKRRWLATKDTHTRDTHGELDGQTVGIDEPFRLHGLTAMYPGTFGDPAEDINCRCTVIDIIEGLEPTVQRVRNPFTGRNEIASFGTYDEYAKKYLGG